MALEGSHCLCAMEEIMMSWFRKAPTFFTHCWYLNMACGLGSIGLISDDHQSSLLKPLLPKRSEEHLKKKTEMIVTDTV